MPSSSELEPFPPIQPGASLILAWQIKNKPVLLVGGGVVAAGRLSALLDAGAIVTLISPRSGLSTEVAYRIDEEKVVHNYVDRIFEGEEDLKGMEMVLTAIDEAGLSSKICEMCRRLRIAVNVADVPPECDFYFGSIVRRGPLQIMVSTQGKGPRIANRVRRAIEDGLPDQVGDAIESVGKLRMELRKKVPARDPETIAKRMSFMIRVCDKWSLDELASMSEEMRTQVVDGWEDGIAKGYWDVKGGRGGKVLSALGIGRCPVHQSPDGRAKRCPFILTSSGFVMGLGTAGIIASLVLRFRR